MALLGLVGCARKEHAAVVTVLSDRDIEGLDPHTAGTLFQTESFLSNVYEALVTTDADFKLVPALALSWTNADELTWDFQLRPSVPFQSGGTLDAEDVVFSLKRAREHPRSVRKAVLAEVSTVEATGPLAVRIRTLHPDALLATRLKEIAIVSRRFTPAQGDDALAIPSSGTGAYRVLKREEGRTVDVERFDGYWKGPAHVRSARFVAKSFGDAAANALVPGDSRLIFWARPGSPAFRTASAGYQLYTRPNATVPYLAFDLRRDESPAVVLPKGVKGNPFRDPLVREAIALSLDHRALARDDFLRTATQLVPPTVFGYDPTLPEPAFDRALARRLLASTPYRDGFDVELDVRKLQERFVAALTESLLAIGIRTRLNLLDDDAFFAKLKAGRSSLYVLRFSCRSGDAQELLDRWVRSKDPGAGYGAANYSYDVSPVAGLDEAIDAARHEMNVRARQVLLQEIMRRVMEARVALPLVYEQDVTFVSRDLLWTPRADGFRQLFGVRLKD